MNRALAVAMVEGADAGLDLLASLDGDERVARHHRLYAMRGHLLELAGSPGAARAAFSPQQQVNYRMSRALHHRFD